MTKYLVRPLRSAKRAILTLPALFILPISTLAQAGRPHTPQAASAKSLAFEVISIRPAKPDCGMSSGGPPGRYMGRCITVWGLIYNAYFRSFQDYPPDMPAWVDKDKFDVEAKADDNTTAAMQKLSREEQQKEQRLMLQSLLADRFGLRIHYDSKVQPVYELVAAKGGPKMKPLPADQKPEGANFGPGEITLHGGPIAMFAYCLTQLAGRKIVDKTGLMGNYNIDLKWARDDQQVTLDTGPTLFTALQEQLGLKLESAKAPVDVLVIDHIEKPSPN